MQIEIAIGKTKALELGIEPGTHTVQVPVAELAPEERGLLDRYTEPKANSTCYRLVARMPIADDHGNVPRVWVETPSSLTANGLLAALWKTEEQVAALRRAIEAEAEDILALGPDDVDQPGQLMNSRAYRMDERVREHVDVLRREHERRAAEALIAEREAWLETLRSDQSIVGGQAPGSVYDLRVVPELRKKAEELAAEGRELIIERQRKRDEEIAAARDEWLRERDPVAVQMAADGYNITARSKAAVQREVLDAIEEMGLELVEEPDEEKDRRSPGDAAYLAAKAVQKVDLVTAATVMWGVWEPDPEDYECEERQAEVLHVSVRCPWQEDVSEYLTLYLTGDAFAD